MEGRMMAAHIYLYEFLILNTCGFFFSSFLAFYNTHEAIERVRDVEGANYSVVRMCCAHHFVYWHDLSLFHLEPTTVAQSYIDGTVCYTEIFVFFTSSPSV